MTNWNPDIRSTNNLLQRVWLMTPTTGQAVIAPAGAGIIRASLVGAGGANSAGAGFGAAFARKQTTCTPGESFTAKIGNNASALDAGSAAGDTELLRTSGSVQLALAKRGTGTAAGQASASVGDLKRSGGAAQAAQVGVSPLGGTVWVYFPGGCPGDLDDDYSLGMGGDAPVYGYGYYTAGPMMGCGGVGNAPIYRNASSTVVVNQPLAAGHGAMCIEFYRTDPGYGA